METIRVGQLIERLSKLDKYDKVYCGGSPVADGPEPVAHAGCVDLDPQRDDEIEKLEDGLADANEQIKDLKNEIESIKDSISEALQLIDDGESKEAVNALRQLINE